MEQFIAYAPILIVVVAWLMQNKTFVTPVQLEEKHRQIISEAEEKFATKDSVKNTAEDLKDIKCKIDKIYDVILFGGNNPSSSQK